MTNLAPIFDAYEDHIRSEERERCARLCDEHIGLAQGRGDWNDACIALARMIRNPTE